MNTVTIFKKYWPLLSILFVAGVLRFYGLLNNPISLFSDEVDMGYQAYSLIKTGCDYSGNCLPIQFHSFSDVQPPIPIYFIAISHLLGVPLDFSIRFVPAVFGLLGIIFTYLLFENLSSKKIFNLELGNVGLMSSLVLAFVPWHFTYSRIGFALAMLYFFVLAGFYFYSQYLITQKNYYLYLSCLFLGLTPMVYNTAKMAIVFYPILLILFPNAFYLFKKNTNFKIALALMFLPLALMFLSGGTTARFDYISVFSDPTAPTEVNYQRLQDSGPGASVGTKTNFATKIFHNKPVFFATNVINNYFSLLSSDYLFTKGDPNLRHSPANSGMLYRSLAPIIIVGIYFLIRNRHNRLLAILCLFSLVAMSTSAITRDGANHGSRSFMLLLPLVFVSGAGLAYLYRYQKIIFWVFFGLITFESIFFIHDYWYHYRYGSAGSWSYGMKELIMATQKYPNQPIVISPKNENPLIFYAYYTRFDPKKFQVYVKNHTLYNSTFGKFNLDGNQIGDTNLYIATLVDLNKKSEASLPNAIYFLAKLETINSSIRSISTNSGIIRMPTGEPLYYEIHY